MTMYDPHTRAATLRKLVAALTVDPRISGILLVGSGARDFHDAYSDLDLALVIDEEADPLVVFENWGKRLAEILPVLWQFRDVRGPEVGLYALILQDFLEIDISFQSMSALQARTANWRILMDRTGSIPAVQKESWAARAKPDLQTVYLRRLDSIWHYITHTAVSIKRNQRWRAAYNLGQIRERTIELEGLLNDCVTRHFREVDRLPEGRLVALEETWPSVLEAGELLRALKAATDCFFDTAARVQERVGGGRPAILHKAMIEYLALMADLILNPAEKQSEV